MDSIIYRINSSYEIVYTSSMWNSFARENLGEDSIEKMVMNNNLMDFISDPETREIYKMLVEKAKKTKTTVKVPFRCDAPGLRRFLVMEIEQLENGLTEFRSILKKSEKRKNVRLLERNIPRSDDFVKICSWCKKVYISETDSWAEAEEAVIQMKLFEMKKLPGLTHSMCDNCYNELSKDI
jgi:hypothetical protein